MKVEEGLDDGGVLLVLEAYSIRSFFYEKKTLYAVFKEFSVQLIFLT